MTATYTIDITVELAQGDTIRFPDCLSIVGFRQAPNQHTLRALVHDTDADPSLNGRHVDLHLRAVADAGVEIAERIPVDVNPAPPQPVRLPPEPNVMSSSTRYAEVRTAEQRHLARSGAAGQPVDTTPDPRLLSRERR